MFIAYCGNNLIIIKSRKYSSFYIYYSSETLIIELRVSFSTLKLINIPFTHLESKS